MKVKKDPRPWGQIHILQVPEALWTSQYPCHMEAPLAPTHFKDEETEESKVKSLAHAHKAGEWWMLPGTQNGLNAEPELAWQHQEVVNSNLRTF